MASGRPDWFGTIVAAGKYDTTFIPIGLDQSGAILALMKGAYDSLLKTIAVDDAGVMKANISVQDLDFLTVRPAYGQMKSESDSTLAPTGEPTSLKKVSGRGVIMGGYVWWTTALRESITKLEIDGSEVFSLSAQDLFELRATDERRQPLYINRYDDDDDYFLVNLTWGITFETSFEVKVYQTTGDTRNYDWGFYWALVP